MYSLVESYLNAKESFSALWKRRQESIKDQLAEVKETYEQKREDVICSLEEKNIKGSIPFQLDRLVDSLVLDEEGEIGVSAREKTVAFVTDRHVELDAGELDTLIGDIAQLSHLKEDVHKERLTLLGKPDREMIEAVSERNQTACRLLESSLGNKLRSSEERVLVSLVGYGEKRALRQASQREKVRKQGKKAFVERAPFLSKEPRYSLEEVQRHLTPYAIESICTRLLGEPNRTSNRRHLR